MFLAFKGKLPFSCQRIWNEFIISKFAFRGCIAKKNVCIIKHCFGLMYCNDTLWDVVDLLLRFFVQDQRGREDFRKALFISLSNRIYIPLWVVLVCSNMTSVSNWLGSKYTLAKNTSNKQFFVSVFFLWSLICCHGVKSYHHSRLWSGLTC